MKILITLFTFLPILLLTLSFDVVNQDVEGKYFCVHAYNHDKSEIVISNIFYASEFESGMNTLSEISCGQYIETELDFDTDSYSNIIIYSHEQKSYVYDDRMDAITNAKEDGYTIEKFKVKSEKGKLYEIEQ